jgi:bacterioferritin (cytochrome b1)
MERMTTTHTESTTLLNELAVLLRLTRTEAQVARVRISQARRDEIRRELAKNSRDADARAARIQTTIRRLGGAPDVFADAIGRVAAMTKATFEQGQPFSEGLLGDLALEHQLRDRAVFIRVLAEAQDETRVVDLMRQLEEAHTETISWIVVRLAEVAQGGPAALSPTPAQAAVSTVTRLALAPSRQSAALINQAVNLFQRSRNTAEKAVESTRQKTRVTAKATDEVLSAGRDAALARAEEVAPSADVRKAAHGTREDLGTIEAHDLPIKAYENQSGASVIKAVNTLDDVEDVRVVLRFEKAHKARKGVVTAAQKRITALAVQSVNA